MSGDAFLVDGIAFWRNEDWLADDWRSRTASSESIFSEKRGIVASTESGMDNLIEVERIDKEIPPGSSTRSQIVQAGYGLRGCLRLNSVTR